MSSEGIAYVDRIIGLDRKLRVVMRTIASRMFEKPTEPVNHRVCRKPQQWLADHSGISVETLRRRLRELEKRRFIDRERVPWPIYEGGGVAHAIRIRGFSGQLFEVSGDPDETAVDDDDSLPVTLTGSSIGVAVDQAVTVTGCAEDAGPDLPVNVTGTNRSKQPDLPVTVTDILPDNHRNLLPPPPPPESGTARVKGAFEGELAGRSAHNSGHQLAANGRGVGCASAG